MASKLKLFLGNPGSQAARAMASNVLARITPSVLCLTSAYFVGVSRLLCIT